MVVVFGQMVASHHFTKYIYMCMCVCMYVYEGLLNLNTSPNVTRVIKSRRMRYVGHVACMGEMKNLVRKPEGERPCRRCTRAVLKVRGLATMRRRYAVGSITAAHCRQSTNFSNGSRRWEGNIRMDLREIGW
jgi:hypothetical protein